MATINPLAEVAIAHQNSDNLKNKEQNTGKPPAKIQCFRDVIAKDLDKENVPPPDSPVFHRRALGNTRAPLGEIRKDSEEKTKYIITSVCFHQLWSSSLFGLA